MRGQSCQPDEAASSATGAPPQLRQERSARCAGPRLAGTATTEPTPASPARLSSGGQSVVMLRLCSPEMVTLLLLDKLRSQNISDLSRERVTRS